MEKHKNFNSQASPACSHNCTYNVAFMSLITSKSYNRWVPLTFPLQKGNYQIKSLDKFNNNAQPVVRLWQKSVTSNKKWYRS